MARAGGAAKRSALFLVVVDAANEDVYGNDDDEDDEEDASAGHARGLRGGRATSRTVDENSGGLGVEVGRGVESLGAVNLDIGAGAGVTVLEADRHTLLLVLLIQEAESGTSPRAHSVHLLTIPAQSADRRLDRGARGRGDDGLAKVNGKLCVLTLGFEILL